MLRIKKDIDLKELESKYVMVHGHFNKNKNALINIDAQNNIDILRDNSDNYWLYKTSALLFDLIKADLVEKVSEVEDSASTN